MRTLEECHKIIAKGDSDKLTPDEKKLIDDELKEIHDMIDNTDKLLEEFKALMKG